ncbi:TetR/AcrR family transcriptional regulator C-terminal domain-containing protein [Micromonospora sp. STR1_7]|uniref:TetR/AcrR family transcriptional regulator C-terminal domain-containing protein n=1 Tax=Micromonospora parastrephiae TaxID=2806101 RepID=A0ABS1XRN7_9ACTN|nr:TetR/AcrR family transcriptional regulator C-terminal domain-containing protein [Micromonospora parastrephiae]MBM0231923.1 TetR/AcrR family transcriptional regulator C-terminal domain-containing protein [Micromonospora parastrephiae]
MTTAEPGVPTSAGRRDSRTPPPVWLRAEPSRTRRKPPLTLERIVDAAVALLDELGVEGLTMRCLAQQLDVTATALYWHVKTKDDVLDLAVDRIFGDVPIPNVSDSWLEDTRVLARAWRGAMLRHPWAPSLVGRPMLGPNVLARTEFLQSALVRGGCHGRQLAVATRMLANYVIGASLTEATWHRSADPHARAAARDHIAASANAYPTLNASGHLDDTRWNDDLLFEEGLNGILLAAARTGTPE